MIEKLHGATNSLLWKIIFSVISVSFVLSGVAGYMITQADTSAVKVNGEEISQQTFQQQYNNEYQRMSEQLGPQFAAVADSPEFISSLRANVLKRLTDQELLRQYVNELKLNIHDNRIKQEIVSTESFKQDGKFNNDLYQKMLRTNNITADTYANYVREALKLEQLQYGILDSDFSVPSQQDKLAKLFFQRREVRLATLPLNEEISKQTVSEQEITDYYNANKAAFAVPELVKVQYIDVDKQDAEKSSNVTDVEIAQYYQDNKAQFTTKPQQHLAHIQLANESDAQATYQALQGGSDFAQLAKERSIDKPSAINGGDLNWVNSGELPKAFEDVANKLNIGEISQPVKIDNSFHIIKLIDKKAASELPLANVKQQIANQIRTELANEQFYKIEKDVATKVTENKESLSEVEKLLGKKVREIGYFSRNDVPAELNYPNIISSIFDTNLLQNRTNSEPISVGEQHSIVFRVTEYKPAGTKTLEEAKTDITNLLKRQKAESVMLEKAKELVKKPESLSFSEKQTFIFADNQDPELNNSIFAMAKPTDKPVYQATKTSQGDIVIIELSKIEEGKIDAQQQKQFNTQMAQIQQTALQETLIQALRHRAKIEVNEEFMKQAQE